jgi:hypothetical protein
LHSNGVATQIFFGLNTDKIVVKIEYVLFSKIHVRDFAAIQKN